MRLIFTPQGGQDYTYWQRTDRALVKRVNRLLDDALRNPTGGIGKPEALKYGIAGAWSRRITEEHRLVHQVLGEDLVAIREIQRWSLKRSVEDAQRCLLRPRCKLVRSAD